MLRICRLHATAKSGKVSLVPPILFIPGLLLSSLIDFLFESTRHALTAGYHPIASEVTNSLDGGVFIGSSLMVMHPVSTGLPALSCLISRHKASSA